RQSLIAGRIEFAADEAAAAPPSGDATPTISAAPAASTPRPATTQPLIAILTPSVGRPTLLKASATQIPEGLLRPQRPPPTFAPAVSYSERGESRPARDVHVTPRDGKTLFRGQRLPPHGDGVVRRRRRLHRAGRAARPRDLSVRARTLVRRGAR